MTFDRTPAYMNFPFLAEHLCELVNIVRVSSVPRLLNLNFAIRLSTCSRTRRTTPVTGSAESQAKTRSGNPFGSLIPLHEPYAEPLFVQQLL